MTKKITAVDVKQYIIAEIKKHAFLFTILTTMVSSVTTGSFWLYNKHEARRAQQITIQSEKVVKTALKQVYKLIWIIQDDTDLAWYIIHKTTTKVQRDAAMEEWKDLNRSRRMDREARIRDLLAKEK